MRFGPQTVLLAIAIQFRPRLSSGAVKRTVDRLEKAIRARHPEIRYISIEAESTPKARG
jgi:divalent metal cation (Fe/Co/Zn/Cd) transporter